MRPFILLCLLAAYSLAGCVVNPVTGESEFTLMSPQQEVAIGERNYQPSQQAQGGLYVVDPEVPAYVRRVGMALARQSHRPELPFEFVVLNSSVPNAWAMPGGKIAINRGLLVLLEDEAQLAAVLGHEIVHVTARHAARQMTQAQLLGVGAQVLDISTRESEYGALINQGAGLGVAAWQAHYSRGNELEADDVGMEYMSQLGYDPQGAVELQQVFLALSKNQSTDLLSSFFASHPPSAERVAANKAHAQSLSGSLRHRDDFQAVMKQLKKDKPAYDKQQQAISALQQQDLNTALQLVDDAIRLQPKENSFWETRAHIFVSQGKAKEALRDFDQAIALNPKYFSPLLGKGSLLVASGNYAEAEKSLIASKQLLNTSIASYFLGQVKLQQGNKNEAIAYLQEAAAGGGKVGAAAREQLAKLQPAATPLN